MFMMLTMVPKLIHRLRHKQTGQSMTEFALVLPILLLLLFGVMDFGRLLFLYVQVSNGAREAARYGSMVGLEGTPMWQRPQYVDCPAIRQAAIETFGIGLGIQPNNIDVEYDNGSAIKSNVSCAVGAGYPDARLIAVGDRVRVTVRTEFSLVTPILSSFIPRIPVTFTAARTILKGGVLVRPGSD